MSEAEAPPAPAPEATPAPESAGSMLRRAREAAGLHVANLAVNLKVPVRKLEALEEDRYDLLPDAVFVRALASSVCRTLKIDAQPILERLPQSNKPRLVQDDDGINAPFRAPGDGPAPGLLDHLSRPVVLGVIALLMAAVVLVFLPDVDGKSDQTTASEIPTQATEPSRVGSPGALTTRPSGVAHGPAPAPPSSAVASTAPSAPVSTAVPAAAAVSPAPVVTSKPAPAAPAVASRSASAAAPATAVPAAATTATARPGLQAAASAPVAATAAAVRASASAPAWPTGLVAFRTTGISWIQVNDARGQEVLRRLMGPGDTAMASGTTPLTVTVGSVASTEVQIRGKPFNLGPVNRDNVARFEVR